MQKNNYVRALFVIGIISAVVLFASEFILQPAQPASGLINEQTGEGPVGFFQSFKDSLFPKTVSSSLYNPDSDLDDLKSLPDHIEHDVKKFQLPVGP